MGGIRIMTVSGISVFVHWSWLPMAFFMIMSSDRRNLPIEWRIAEYLTLFGIVLLHEFGHLLACRSVGGRGDNIVLWPLGGIAFGIPPDRPGPTLWTVLGGPLVNVLLLPVFYFVQQAYGFHPPPLDAIETYTTPGPTNLQQFIRRIYEINIGLLIFNMLPIFPLDGGQTLRSLLWFVIGRGRSLQVVSVIGIMAAAVGFVWAISTGQVLLTVVAFFVAVQAVNGYQLAQRMLREDRAREQIGL